MTGSIHFDKTLLLLSAKNFRSKVDSTEDKLNIKYPVMFLGILYVLAFLVSL